MTDLLVESRRRRADAEYDRDRHDACRRVDEHADVYPISDRTGDAGDGPASRTPRVALAAGALLLLAALLAAGIFHCNGGHWFVVRTPSMGTAAPVGTLVLTMPTAVAKLHVGDVVAFHPPTEPNETYTHRVILITDGWVRTRGDINGAADPWPLRNSDIVGRVFVIVPRIGWLLRATPLLLLGGLVIAGLTRLWFRPTWRGPARTAGSGLLFAVAAWQLRPFVGADQLASSTATDGTARITAVGTGLLPVRLTTLPGHGQAKPVDLSAGDVREAVITHAPRSGHIALAAHLHLGLWGWVALFAISAAPLLWTMIVGYRPAPPQPVQPHSVARHSVARHSIVRHSVEPELVA